MLLSYQNLTMQLPLEVWRSEVWERGLNNSAAHIVRWSMMSTECRAAYLGACRKLLGYGWKKGKPREKDIRHNIPALPPGLLMLELEGVYGLVDALVPHLPPGLTRLCSKNNWLQMSDSSVPLLPRTLERLIMHGSAARLTDTCVKDLPRGLKHLNISRLNAMTGACLKDLPRSLASLHLRPNVGSLTDASLQHLPRGLIDLVLAGGGVGVTGAGMQHLPRTLEHFFMDADVRLTGAFARDLPTQLKSLSLNCSIDDAVVRNLPRELLTMSFGMWNCEITDAGAQELPRGLIYLHMANSTLTDACAERLPPNLQELALHGNCRLTRRIVPHLPKRLRKFVCGVKGSDRWLAERQ